jgi:large subunit ribosomal protein L24
MHKIRKGDPVVVTTGKDKGRRGVVLAVLGSKRGANNVRVLIEGLNLVKRSTKANPTQEKPGGIIEKEAPLAVSNVAIFNQVTGKADKVGFKKLGDGRKVRVFKATGEVIDS